MENEEQEITLSVMFTVLFDYTLMLAPFSPFISENNYKQLVTDFTTNGLTLDQEVNDTNHRRNLVSVVQQIRKKMGLKPWNKIHLEYSGYETFITNI
jgi:valyl-tRNA synthetase